MPEKDAHIIEVIRDVIGTSRKVREKVIRLVRKRHPGIGPYKIRRVYERYGFSFNKKLKRRIKYNPANPIDIPIEANREWAMDLMSDALIDGRRFRTLNIIDQYNRKCIGFRAGLNFPSRVVINELEKVIERHGKPNAILTDNGPEFISRIFRKWMQDNDIEHVRIQNGKPQQNAVIERFNKIYREDVLNAEIFKSIIEAQEITDIWINDYNTNRPHQSLKYQTPLEYAS